MWRFGLVEKVRRKATQSMFETMWLKAHRATWPPPGWAYTYVFSTVNGSTIAVEH